MPDGPQQPESVTVTLDLDADVLEWLREQPGWRREINDLLRFTMESHLIREAAFEDVSPEALAKGEAAAPQPVQGETGRSVS